MNEEWMKGSVHFLAYHTIWVERTTGQYCFDYIASIGLLFYAGLLNVI